VKAATRLHVSFGHLGTHVANGAIYSLPYDMLTDLEPVVMLPSNPMVVVSRSTLPAKNLKELIAWLKANPDKATAGTAGAGSGAHIAGVYLQGLTLRCNSCRIAALRGKRSGRRPDRHHRRPASNSMQQIRPAASAPMRSPTRNGSGGA
jgi:hypothetical protein